MSEGIDTKSESLKKFFNVTKIVATTVTAITILYAAMGPLWTIPRDITQNRQQLHVVEGRIIENTKDIDVLKTQVSEDKMNIIQMKKTIDEINVKQNTIHEQYTDLNKNIIELNTTMKFFGEAIKELKQEVKRAQ
jgi:chromosome segregation ATPase